MTRPTGLDIDVDLDLLASCYRDTRAVLAAIPDERWDAPSPCTQWSVRQVAEHLVEALDFFSATVSGAPGSLPADLPAAYDAVTARCLAAFADPGALAADHPFGDGRQPGRVIATISLSETVVHGWDLASAAGVPYTPNPAAVATLRSFAAGPKAPGLFADPVPVPAHAPPFVALLGKLGRAA
ncbi:MAG TPA: TIGR03086 family metal-binding protein [Actinophytocola sp.]|jgi:uncharacterized protein (TIGR03086 family)|nr:TIGR03086 family metal-binding protein [Actinophytocola sp.]